MPHGRAFARLADLLRRDSQRPELKSKLSQRRCLSAWPDAVGRRIAQAAKPVRMRDGTLTVAVKSSVWKNELALMRSKITEALNEKLGEPVVKRITFSSAWPQEATGQGTASSGSEDEACELRPIPSPEEAEIRQAVSRIDDDRVSGALFAAWTTKRSLDMGRKALGWNECPACGALKRPEDSACPVCASRKG